MLFSGEELLTEMQNEPTQEATSQKKVPLWKNPYVVAALVGMLTVNLIRPCTRYIPDPPPVLGTLPAYTLIDQDGKEFGSEDLRGQVYVVNFFFTSCVTICPKVLNAAKMLEERYERSNVEVRLVTITVDPETDTPERLKEYAKGVGADFSRWSFLTGTRPQLESLIVGGFKTYMGEKQEDDAGLVDIGHGSRFVLVDHNGGVRGHYEITEMGIDEVFHRSKHVLRQKRESE